MLQNQCWKRKCILKEKINLNKKFIKRWHKRVSPLTTMILKLTKSLIRIMIRKFGIDTQEIEMIFHCSPLMSKWKIIINNCMKPNIQHNSMKMTSLIKLFKNLIKVIQFQKIIKRKMQISLLLSMTKRRIPKKLKTINLTLKRKHQ